MSATRSLWRSLLTVLLAVSLVAVSVLGAGHAHAGARHGGVLQHAAAVHPDAAGPERTLGMSGCAELAGDETPTSPCGLNCCCHATFLRWDFPAVAVGWRPGRMLAGIHEVLFDSLAPESLPEPPRTFA